MSGEVTPSVAARVTAIVLATLFALAVPMALMMALMSVMAFDAPGSTENRLLWALVFGVWATPPALVLGVVLAIVAAVKGRWRWLAWAVAPVVVLATYLAVSLLLLNQLCAGSFAC